MTPAQVRCHQVTCWYLTVSGMLTVTIVSHVDHWGIDKARTTAQHSVSLVRVPLLDTLQWHVCNGIHLRE